MGGRYTERGCGTNVNIFVLNSCNLRAVFTVNFTQLRFACVWVCVILIMSIVVNGLIDNDYDDAMLIVH